MRLWSVSLISATLSILATSSPGANGAQTAKTIFARAHLLYGLPFLMILLQKLDSGHSKKVHQSPIGLGRWTRPGPMPTRPTGHSPTWFHERSQDERSWATMNSSQNGALIKGRAWNTSGSRSKDEEMFAVLFDLRKPLEDAFPCGHYDDLENLEEWAGLTLEIWLPCQYANSSQSLGWKLDHAEEIYGELFGVAGNECNINAGMAAVDCAVSRRRRRILEVDLQPNIDAQECQTDVVMPEDWKRIPPVHWVNASEDFGYRIVELKRSMAEDLGLTMDPKKFQWLGLHIYWGNGRDEDEKQQKAEILDKYSVYLRVKTQNERCQIRCGSKMLCRVKSHCAQECGKCIPIDYSTDCKDSC